MIRTILFLSYRHSQTDRCFRWISICSPRVLRMVSRVVSCGLPSPRSMATTVFTATTAKSANVCWLMPNCFRLSLMIFPISCKVIIALYWDFDAKIHKTIKTTKENRNKLRNLCSTFLPFGQRVLRQISLSLRLCREGTTIRQNKKKGFFFLFCSH